MYKIDSKGHLIASDDGVSTLKEAIADRIYELNRLVKNNAFLEIDYDHDDGVWYAYNYIPSLANIFAIEDKNRKPVVAFDESVDYQTVGKILSENDIYYVD